MKILAVEFSSPQRSVALLETGGAAGQVVCLNEVVQTGERSTSALSMIEQCLQAAGVEREQLEVLAVGLGPGSYTGIRGAIALAQGWCLAGGIKLAGIGSADALALQAQQEGLGGTVTVVIDAQRGEFYVAQYEVDADGCRVQRPLRLATAEAVRALLKPGEVVVGGAEGRIFAGHRSMFPRAVAVGKLASRERAYVEPEVLAPIYLRETSFVKAPPARILP